MERCDFTVDQDSAGLRLDIYLSRMLPDISRTQVQRLIAEGLVRVGGREAKANFKVAAGDAVSCQVPPVAEPEVKAEKIELDIVYEDSDLIVVNKSQGMVVHPAGGNFSGTLVNALLNHCGDLSGINGVLRPGIVHRIDKDTSGLLVATKNDRAHQHLAEQIRQHSVKRVYLALVHGVVSEPGGLIDAPIGRAANDRKKMAVVLKNGKAAITEYRVLERLRDYTLVECRLKTGRTHQIRVHMAYIRHPVAGDPKYGPKKPRLDLAGQALHAKTLGFVHPTTNKWLEFSVSPPRSFLSALAMLGSRLTSTL